MSGLKNHKKVGSLFGTKIWYINPIKFVELLILFSYYLVPLPARLFCFLFTYLFQDIPCLNAQTYRLNNVHINIDVNWFKWTLFTVQCISDRFE
jgi:hypothetical protein